MAWWREIVRLIKVSVKISDSSITVDGSVVVRP